MQNVIVLALAWSLFGSGAHSEQQLHFATSAGTHVRVETANGFITVTTGRAGAGVNVTVTKRADTVDGVRALSVATQQHRNAISLRAVYPQGCGSSCGGEISFAVTAPPGTVLDLRTSNGQIEATGISADARLASSNGSVIASYAAFTGVKQVSLTTSNGRLELSLPASSKIGRLRMETSVGRISSDWPLRVDRSSLVGAAVDQTLGPGGPSVSLTTTNGSIALKKR
jgi:DUF4097 and DUF4098 domain-containing protein YvlB